tara:strand:- start:261 stop:422 length:162 start_codon:yes stop_codon:yes gene_type:complete
MELTERDPLTLGELVVAEVSQQLAPFGLAEELDTLQMVQSEQYMGCASNCAGV